MPKTNPPAGAPCWFELASTDPGVSGRFHRELYGWSASDVPVEGFGSYSFLGNGRGTVGALCSIPPGAPAVSGWNVYFTVADVDAATARARDLGAQVFAAPFDVHGHGRMSTIADPTGAALCLWQPLRPDAGDFVMFEDHAVGWVELASRNAVAARDFYGALLGWKFKASPVPIGDGLQYLEFAVDGRQWGGIMPMTPEWGDLPSHWSVYILVPDVDDCAARAPRLGGKVCVPPFDAPGVGRIARIDDPTGAGAYVIKLAEQSATAPVS